MRRRLSGLALAAPLACLLVVSGVPIGAVADNVVPVPVPGSSAPADASAPVQIGDAAQDARPKLSVEGTVRSVAVDPPPVNLTTGQAAPALPGGTTKYYVVTADGSSIPITGDIPKNVTSGDHFSGTLGIPQTVAASVPAVGTQALDDSVTAPIDSSASAGSAIVDQAAVLDTEFPVAEAQVEPAAAVAAAAGTHTVYVAVVVPAGSSASTQFYTNAQVTALVSRISSYWNAQSGGTVAALSIGAPILHYVSTQSTCNDLDSLWNEASSKFGFGSSWQNAFAQDRHVIVLTPDETCFGVGTGSVGQNVDDGGFIQSTVNDGFDHTTLAHEFGHNLGLEHANLLTCDNDDLVEGTFDQGCGEYEYGDYYDIMGIDLSWNGVPYDVLTTLNTTSRLALGFLPFSTVESYGLASAESSRSWTSTLNSSAGSSGTRSFELIDPISGSYYYLEYRSGTGADAGAFYTSGNSAQYAPGVRVMVEGTDYSSYVIPSIPDASAPRTRDLALGVGESFTTQTTGTTITVNAMTPSSATVTVTETRQPALKPKPKSATLTGDDVVGGSLAVTQNNWNIPGLAFTYSWLRDGVAVSGQTSSSYETSAADVGHAIAASITASRDGYAPGTVTTNSITIASGPHDFADVLPDHPFFTPIEWMFSSGLSTGTAQPQGLPLYKPVSPVSRMAMAAFLYRYSGESFTPPKTATFADVDSSSPFYTAVEWMAAKNISTGTAQPSGKPLFKPVDPVSRQAMALFLARFAHADLAAPTTASFADVDLSSPFAAAIGWMKDTGLSVGTAQQSGLPLYKPADPVSRQAMAAFLYRYSQLPPQN